MGEAKDRKKHPWPRQMHVERHELLDLLNYVVTPVQGPQGQWNRGTKTRDERKSLKSALTQLGIYQMWKAAQATGRAEMALPAVRIADMSEEAVNYLLGLMTDMSNRESLSLIEFEERLEELKVGLYEVPEDMLARVEQPAEEPPALAAVPQEAV